ncbi:MAG: DNA polymerase Y family protein [Chitinophagaceae bacterium]|nr:MAG: DNA polymerase Y family protein [Chitinophagaceae bacterium]
MNRYLSIWFRHLFTDGYAIQQVALRNQSFVMAAPERGRMVIRAVNALAQADGIHSGMVVADARAIHPSLTVVDAKEGMEQELLDMLSEWCLRFTPDVALDPPDGLLLDITGCPHLWGGERAYLKDLVLKLRGMGYDARAAIADTIGAAWAVARYGTITPIVESGKQKEALSSLPPAALRLEQSLIERLHKLGLYTIGSFIDMPRQTLRGRFGQDILTRIDQALGNVQEPIQTIRPVPPYEERLPCLEPIRTAGGIEIAIRELLSNLCLRLYKESKGLRTAILTCYRVDNEIQRVSIRTGRASRNETHLFKLFELKIRTIRPALGIELFLLEATVTENLTATQESLWHTAGVDEEAVAELMDKIAGKIGSDKIHRYLPEEHYWPEHSYKEATGLQEKPSTQWRTDKLRPVYLLSRPEKITVSVPLPDYPPLLFRHNGKLYRIIKADGPERIEREWWLEDGLHRDYYRVEDESGARYWLFRSGYFDDKQSGWYLHGFFA